MYPPTDQFDVRNKPFTSTAWLHLLVIFVIWTSPFCFRWPLILVGIVLYYVQILTLGDCLLTRRQFATRKRSITFYYYLLVKFGFKPDGYHIRFIADYVVPPVILAAGYLWQVVLNNPPLIF